MYIPGVSEASQATGGSGDIGNTGSGGRSSPFTPVTDLINQGEQYIQNGYTDVIHGTRDTVTDFYNQRFSDVNNTWGIVKDAYGTVINGAFRMGNEAYNELSGRNYDRQKQWETQVAADAAAEQAKNLANIRADRERADRAASMAAYKANGIGGRGLGSAYSDAADSMQTDFLGLR
jgi:hypothetical protein